MEHADQLSIRSWGDGCVVPVKATPGASRNRIVGVLGDCLKIAVSAPPEAGKANEAIALLLAQGLGVDKRAVKLISGQTNPRKEFCVAGLSPSEAADRLRHL
ncbi:MAG: DUF167 domain-containing protein [Planctomycetes bacterium]|jgi:uncharacterized protein (TIGR00251 family)|nr:DUF167 domain-containing protein [Planctomycetota bacterium]